MSLETGNYVNDLVVANPTATDPKSQGDDHLRLLKTVLKQTLNGFAGAILVTATDTGTASAHVLTPATALVGYTTMLSLLYLPAVTSTGACTVNVSGLGAKSIKTLGGADPSAGDLVAGKPILLMYDGTNFVSIAGSGFITRGDAQTINGNITFAGSSKGVTQALGTSSTDFATCAFVAAQVLAATLPGQGTIPYRAAITDGAGTASFGIARGPSTRVFAHKTF